MLHHYFVHNMWKSLHAKGFLMSHFCRFLGEPSFPFSIYLSGDLWNIVRLSHKTDHNML